MSLDSVAGLNQWPIEYDEVFPYYEKVLVGIGLSGAHSDIHEGRHLMASSKSSSTDVDIKFSTWMGWRSRNFAVNPVLRRKLSGAHVVEGSIVYGIRENSGEVAEIEATDRFGETVTYRARTVILAAGTFGNTRILAGSDVAADLPQLGSGFVDHVSKRVAALSVTDWDRFRDFASHRRYKGVLCSPRLVPTERFVRRSTLLPSYAHFEFELPAESFPRQARDLLRARQANAKSPGLLSVLTCGVRDLPQLLESISKSIVKSQRPIFKSSNVYLRVDVQQPTRRESRLTWQNAGTPGKEVQLEWCVGAEENDSANAFGREVLAVLEDMNVGANTRELLPDAGFKDIFHMMGGTSMATSAMKGVVDTNLKVFGMDNVYVAGASVFPSGGLANPTFTALALAHRLGLYLESN
ncbi:GMC family oxidoreductase [Arthrobacter sp. 754]|uniref:GMC family oxidoreductase n=1 Tax=Arthrobacter sp. 754 TaxID=3156315 RepID=UPI003397BB25